jgi:hypothetical protein
VTINQETVSIEQNGPIAFCETTTCKSIFAEDLNRCLQIWANESKEQTKRIMRNLARRYSNGTTLDTSAILDRHHDFQRSLESAVVVIPFAGALAEVMPSDKLETRRIFEQVLATIETLAFLHQHCRERDSTGRLIATLDDYAVARGLLLAPLTDSIGPGEKVKDHYRALQRVFPNKAFTSAEAIRAEVFNDKMATSRALKKLAEAGVVRCVAEAKGNRPARWDWTGQGLGEVLPERLERNE